MGTLPPINKGGLTSMTLHDLTILMILSIGTSRYNEIQYIRYTSEYIPKLQIHQQIVPLPSTNLTSYKIVIIVRLIKVGFFFQYRVSTLASDAYPLWLVLVICEVWFFTSRILDQFPKWIPINRETYIDRISLRLVYHVEYY